MNKADLAEMDKMLDEEIRNEQKRKDFLAYLLDDYLMKKPKHVFACRAQMGITSSYLASVPLKWVADNVKFAGDLPLFEGAAAVGSKKIPINEYTVDLLQQRNPDWKRQLPMSCYLAAIDNHKFPPLLVVCHQKWAYKKDHDYWGSDGKAIKESVPLTSLDSMGFFLDIEADEASYYALDGQHRLMAIMGLKSLLDNKKLNARTAENKEASKEVLLDEVVDAIYQSRKKRDLEADKPTIADELQSRMDEKIGIEIIPAVQVGESQKDAVTRLRRIFVDVNETPQPLTKGELAQLDVNNGFRIVARTLMVRHELLKGDKTLIKQAQLRENSECYTTLQTVVDVATLLLEQVGFAHWKDYILGIKDLGYELPSDSEIKKAKAILNCYFDALAKLPSHAMFLQAQEGERWKVREEDDGNPIKDNILFRPVAQMALAAAIGQILNSKGIKTLPSIKNELNKILGLVVAQEKKGQLKLRDKSSPWFGVLCDPVDKKMRRDKRDQNLACRLFYYLLCGVGNAEKESLRRSFSEARRIDDKRGYALDKPQTVIVKNISLPKPWNR